MSIEQVELIEGASVSIIETPWQHENITALANKLLAVIKETRMIEHVSGGDREYFRFEWQQRTFHLEFEWYGQSIWIEAESALDNALLSEIFTRIEQHIIV